MTMVLPLLLMLSAQQASAPQELPRARPLNPQAWITPDDYPPYENAVGTVEADFGVNPEGGVTNCKIVTSSSHAMLDTRTCELVTSRGRFEPARDARGKPVAGHWRGRFRWQTPDEPAYPRTSWQSVASVTVSADGHIQSCEDHMTGVVPGAFGTPCEALGPDIPLEMLRAIGKGRPVSRLAFETSIVFADSPLTPSAQWTSALTASGRSRTRFEVSEDGKVEACHSDPGDVEGWMTNMPTLCGVEIGTFLPKVGADGKLQRSSAVMTVVVWGGS